MRNSLGGLPKRTQTFLFFSINPLSVKEFQAQLRKEFLTLITTAKKVKADRDAIEESQAAAKKLNTTAPILPIAGVNISFTKKGLNQVRAFCLVYFVPANFLTSVRKLAVGSSRGYRR